MKKNYMKTIIKSDLFLAALISLAALILVLLFCDIKYEISDDFVVDAVLSGAYTGEYNPHMLFSNVLLGYVLVFFYSYTSHVSWYFVNLILMGFATIFTVNYLCIKKNSRVIGVFFAVLSTVFFTDDLLILPSFTKTASAAIAAGGFLLIETLWTQSEKNSSANKLSASKIVSIIAAIVLMLSGSLLRFSCVYLVAPFVVIMFLLKVIQQRKDEKIVRRVLSKAGCCLLVLFGLFMFQLIGNYINNQSPEYKNYYQYSAARASITDTSTVDWEFYEKNFKDLGLDDLDYDMLNSWSFADNDNYPVSKLNEIGKVYQSVFYNSSRADVRIIDSFLQPYFLENPVFMSTLLLFLVAIEIDRKSAGRILLCLLGQFIMLCVFLYIGRLPYRIIYGLCFALLVSILSCISVKEIPKKGLRVVLILLTAILVAYHIPTYIKDQSYRDLPYNEYTKEADSIFTYSGEYIGSKYRYVITAANPYHNIINYMENDTTHYYLCDFYSTIQNLYYYYTPWERLPLNYWNDNYSYLGGCTMGHPENQKCWEDNGINGLNPYKSFINDNVYIVDNYFIQTKLQYLREHYYPNANVELVDVIDGFYIWHFYLEGA
jgi:hypothetical protein